MGRFKERFNRWTSSEVFDGLMVSVRAGVVYAGRIGGQRRLGDLPGSYAEVTEGPRSHRAAAAVLSTPVVGPAGLLLSLSKKAKGRAYIVFADGTIHEQKIDGNVQMRRALADVARYNAMARAAGAGQQR